MKVDYKNLLKGSSVKVDACSRLCTPAYAPPPLPLLRFVPSVVNVMCVPRKMQSKSRLHRKMDKNEMGRFDRGDTSTEVEKQALRQWTRQRQKYLRDWNEDPEKTSNGDREASLQLLI